MNECSFWQITTPSRYIKALDWLENKGENSRTPKQSLKNTKKTNVSRAITNRTTRFKKLNKCWLKGYWKKFRKMVLIRFLTTMTSGFLVRRIKGSFCVKVDETLMRTYVQILSNCTPSLRGLIDCQIGFRLQKRVFFKKLPIHCEGDLKPVPERKVRNLNDIGS